MRLDELLLAEIWQAQWLSGVLTTTENRMVRVVYRGIWTHRRGPDFTGALLDIGGELHQGDIELHLRASDWYAHGHHDDPAYEAVVLHVVWEDDLDEPVRRRDGQRVPTLVLHDSLAGPLELFPRQHVRPLGALGFEHCAPHLAAAAPDQLHRLFEEAGDRRLREKVARVQARLAGEPPAQTLYWMLADALGYHRNREGMRAVAEAVPIAELEARLLTLSPDDRFPTAAGLLLGTAGFLPVSDRERGLSGLRSDDWRRIESVWRATNPVLLRTTWRLDGVRPTNHPLRRLLSLAGLVATSCEGILGACLARLQSEPARRRLLEWLTGGPVPLGRDRAHEVIVNVVVPFALAYAEWTEDAALAERAAQLWEELQQVAATLWSRQRWSKFAGRVRSGSGAREPNRGCCTSTGGAVANAAATNAPSRSWSPGSQRASRPCLGRKRVEPDLPDFPSEAPASRDSAPQANA
jgi:hypothetical protein